MRLITTIPHHTLSISIFEWNAKYILKIEYGLAEQVYKFKKDQFEGGLDGIKEFITESFLEQNMLRFIEMHNNIKKGVTNQ